MYLLTLYDFWRRLEWRDLGGVNNHIKASMLHPLRYRKELFAEGASIKIATKYPKIL